MGPPQLLELEQQRQQPARLKHRSCSVLQALKAAFKTSFCYNLRLKLAGESFRINQSTKVGSKAAKACCSSSTGHSYFGHKLQSFEVRKAVWCNSLVETLFG
jgi:hypothetical protein